jgi:outer membrane protein, heavy metal efflux system
MMSNIRVSVLLIVACCGFSATHAQVISLDSVLKIIDERNPMLLQYNSKVKALNTYTEGAKGWMAPMVGAGTFMTPYPNQMLMDERDKGSVMFSVEQTIPTPARQNANRDLFASRAAVEEQGRARQFNELRAEAKVLYFLWITSEKKLTILRENERIMELMLSISRLRYPYNQGSLGNIYKAEGRLYEVRNMQAMTSGVIEETGLRLKSLMNLPPDFVMTVDTATQIMYQPNQLVHDSTLLGNQRSDIQQINKSIEVMRLNQRLQQLQSKPDLRLRFDHMQPLGNMPTQFTAMAMISIPIAPWSSKMYKSEVKGMQYDIEAMQREREAVLIEARGMLAGMAARLNRMQEQLNNYETKIIPALRKNYGTVMLAYEENREQLPMVIDAWEAMNMAQMQYVEKMEEYFNMIVSYEKELEK